MRYTTTILAVLWALAFLPAPLSASGAAGDEPALENITYSITDTNEPGVKLYVMEADLKASPSEVCSVVCDYYHLDTYMPDEVSSRVLQAHGNQIILEVVLDLPWPFRDLTSILRIDYDKAAGTARWELVGGNIRKNTGSIRVERRGELSHLRQVTYLDIGRYYPDWFIKIYSRSLTYRIMRAIRERVESPTGVYTKPEKPTS